MWLLSQTVTKLHSFLKDIGLNNRSKFKQEIFPFHESKVSLMVPAEPKSLMFSGCKLRGYVV